MSKTDENNNEKKWCFCTEPLIGYRPKVGPRCRLCNKLIDPKSEAGREGERMYGVKE